MYYDTVTDVTVQTNIIDGMATALISNNWNIMPVVKLLLKSQHFFDVNSRGCYITYPAGLLCRACSAPSVLRCLTTFDTQKTMRSGMPLRQYAADNGLDLGEPPDVSGFPAYYQTPQYYELWINSNTYPKRLQFADMMLTAALPPEQALQ